MMKKNLEISKKFDHYITEEKIDRICTSKEDKEVAEKVEHKFNWLDPKTVLERFPLLLTNYERQEILTFSKIYYIGSSKMSYRKISGDPLCNFGYDDREDYYISLPHDHINYRYEILTVLGKGSYGEVLKVFDHKTGQFAAMKIIRNDKRFLHQSKREVKILQHLLREDQSNTANVIHIENNFIFRRHMCIVFELLSLNLYELVKKNNFRGLKLSVVKRFAHSVAVGLSLVHRKQIIHGDLKPENVLLQQYGRTGVKIIDFGSSVYTDGKLMAYAQSRFYRAPEVILGCHYDTAVDMWSFGCLLAELVLGQPLLPGHDEEDQLALIVELLGRPPASLLARARNRGQTTAQPRPMTRGPPGSRSLQLLLSPYVRQEEERLMIDLITRCLDWQPRDRLTAEQALTHPWLASLSPSHCVSTRKYFHSVQNSVQT